MDITIRNIAGKDLGFVCDIASKVIVADVVTPELFATRVFLDINYDRSGVLAAEVEGSVAGFVVGFIRTHPMEDTPDDSSQGWITLFAVHPDFQGRGVGSVLFDAIENWFLECNRQNILVGPYAPSWWCPGVDVNEYTGAIAWLKKRGYISAGFPLSMDIDLVKFRRQVWISEKEKQLINDGVVFCESSPELLPDIFDFLRQEFPGDWQRFVRETLGLAYDRVSSYTQVQVAIDNGRVVGFTHHKGERFGPFGVASSQRGRGVGAVLLCRTLEVMRNSGLHNAFFLSTYDEAAKLYAQAGFRETRRYALMTKRLK